MLPGTIQGLLYVIYVCMGILLLYGIAYVIRIRCNLPNQANFNQNLINIQNNNENINYPEV